MKKQSRSAAGFLLLALGLALIAAGWLLGQNESVLVKAVNICLECIGIG